jgi:hypothetical protein
MRPPPETGVRWPKQARHTSQMNRLRMRGEELAVAAPTRPSGRDGVMASPPPPRRRWLLEGAGAALQHVLTASTVTYDQAEHCPMHLHAWADSQATGGGPSGRERFRWKAIAYMKNRIRLLSINSQTESGRRSVSAHRTRLSFSSIIILHYTSAISLYVL